MPKPLLYYIFWPLKSSSRSQFAEISRYGIPSSANMSFRSPHPSSRAKSRDLKIMRNTFGWRFVDFPPQADPPLESATLRPE